jgi:hypothetical protein
MNESNNKVNSGGNPAFTSLDPRLRGGDSAERIRISVFIYWDCYQTAFLSLV